MPLYDYTCCSCDSTEEILVGHQRPDTQICIHCGNKAYRQMGTPSIRFRGDGWQTPQPPIDNPWEGVRSDIDNKQMIEKSREFVSRRGEKGYGPKQERKLIFT